MTDLSQREASTELPVEGGGPSDGALLEQARVGDQQAATLLYSRYAQRLHGLAKRRCSAELARLLDPEDIVQSVFRRFFGRVQQGDYNVPEGKELWHLLLVITLNRIRSAESHHRSDKRDIRLTVQSEQPDEQPEGGNQGNEPLLDLAVKEALENLPNRHRTVAELRLAGYEATEIAERIGRSLRTVERLLQECRAKLERFFDDSVTQP